MKKYNKSEEAKNIKAESFLKRSETMAKQKEEIQASLTEKLCKKCNEVKAKDKFNIKKDTKDGLQPYCKECINIIKQEWRQKKKK